MEEQQRVLEWLKSVGLPQYYDSFIEQGYDTLSIIKTNGLENSDFDALKIDKIGHRKCLTIALKKMDLRTSTEDTSKQETTQNQNATLTRQPSINETETSNNNNGTARNGKAHNIVTIEQENLEFVKTIATGEFGITNLVKYKGREVVAKQLKNLQQMDEFMQEAKLMSKIPPHANVVQFLGVVQDRQGITNILMEFVPLGDLQNMIMTNPLAHEIIVEILIGIASGMMHLHSCGIVHRDLAPRNVLIDAQFQPKITDFGLARETTTTIALDSSNSVQVYQSMKSLYGEDVKMPIFIMAPESLQGNFYTKMTDVWAFGCLAYQLVTQQLPYTTVNDLVNLRDHHIEFPAKKLEKKGLAQPLIQLLVKCHARNPDERPSFSQIYSSLTQFKFQQTMQKTMSDLQKEQSLVSDLQQRLEAKQKSESQLQLQLKDALKQVQELNKTMKELEKKSESSSEVVAESVDESCWNIPASELFELEDKTEKSKFKTLKKSLLKSGSNSNSNEDMSNVPTNLKKWKLEATVFLKKPKMSDISKAHVEIGKWSRLRHANLVPFFGFTFLNNSIHAVREYTKGPTLADFLAQNPNEKLSRTQFFNIVLAIADALVFIHTFKLVHGNLKPNNIMVESKPQLPNEFNVRLLDAVPGLQATLQSIHQKTTYNSTVRVEQFFNKTYYAPEFDLTGHNLTSASDVFSFGMIMYEIFEKKPPSRPLEPLEESFPDLENILKSCTAIPVKERPSMDRIRTKLMDLKSNKPTYHFSYTSPTPSTPPISPSKVQAQEKPKSLSEEIEYAFKRGAGKMHETEFEQKVIQGTLMGTTVHHQQVALLCMEYEIMLLTLVVKDKNNEITWSTWQNFASWFTPLVLLDYNYGNEELNNGYNIQRISDIVGQSWFFGFCSGFEAENILNSCVSGSFLFRFSSNHKNYALSAKSDRVRHWRIDVEENWATQTIHFKIDDRKYNSLHHIIETHKPGGEPLKAFGLTQTSYLAFPLDRSHFLPK